MGRLHNKAEANQILRLCVSSGFASVVVFSRLVRRRQRRRRLAVAVRGKRPRRGIDLDGEAEGPRVQQRHGGVAGAARPGRRPHRRFRRLPRRCPCGARCALRPRRPDPAHPGMLSRSSFLRN